MDPHLILQNTELCIAHKQQGGGDCRRGEIFARLPDKGLVFRIHKELKNVNKKYVI